MKVEGKKPVCINFVAQINTNTVNVLNSALSQVANDKFDEIHLLLSTPGGSVADGIVAYNFMRSLPVKVVIYNLGNIDSIGNVVFMGSKHRVSLPISRFMFHGVGFDAVKARFELKDVRERTRGIENDQSMIADILVKHTNLTTEKVQDLFLEAAFLRADEAHKFGIVNEVRQIVLPRDMPIRSLILQG